MPSLLTALDGALVLLGVWLLRKVMSKRPVAPLPPGPKKLPLLENMLDVPTEREWLTFTKWGEKWGDIVSVSVFGQQMIILNSAEIAVEMLEQKGSTYSDRPVLQMGGELVGWKDTLVLVPYGERFRNYRKLFHQTIGTPSAMAQYHHIEERETHKFLQRILSNSNWEHLQSHVRKTAGAIILRISHGYHTLENDDPFVQLADEATDQFSLSTAPGGFLVNLLPALRHVPSWFPGAGFKKIAAEWADTLARMAAGPHELVKKNMLAGIAEPSFTSRLLESEGDGLTPEREHEIKWSAASMYSGGADTTVSAIYASFLALALHPEAAKKAQEEIDSVVGNDRLPTFNDRSSLPYVNALAQEVLRWHSVTPVAIPHRVTQDDIHRGYLIPKGALVIPNIWYMLHDPKVYPDPFAFRPERFLGPNPQPDPRNVCFGFGRRICPGRVLADESVFIACAMTLAVFDVSKSTLDGRVVEPVHEQTTGTISHPIPFMCDIRPRSEKARDLIVSEPVS